MGSNKVAKIIEVVGSSNKSWADAADAAVKTAGKTIKGVTGIQVTAMTATVKNGKISTYKSTVKVAFGVED